MGLNKGLLLGKLSWFLETFLSVLAGDGKWWNTSCLGTIRKDTNVEDKIPEF